MKRTPLYACHVDLSAQMTDFGGFEMPVRYSGDKVEHMAVRQNVGIFDVSHMGEVRVRGPHAEADLNHLLTNDATRVKNGQAFYAAMLNEKAGIVDDVVAYKVSPEEFLICINAGNRDKDVAWIQKHIPYATDESEDWAQIAVQGPDAVDLVASIYGDSVRDIARYHFTGTSPIIARTGYTGEDGFEIFVKANDAVALWKKLSRHATPCGLAARDTLRLEAGMCLYGNDIDENTSPLEAGLSWIVKLNKVTPFIGQSALQKNLNKRLCGLEMIDKGIARHGYEVLSKSGEHIGVITSGTTTPYLNKSIAMAYINKPYFDVGTEIDVKIRDRATAARIVKLPFYRRQENA